MNHLSEKYRKYLVAIVVDGHRYVTMWGADTGDDYTDKLLLGPKGFILIFRDNNSLKAYLLEHKKDLFDQQNVVEWAGYLNNHTPVYCTYDIDEIISSLHQLPQDPDFQGDVLNLILLFSDYAYQTNRQDLLDLYTDDALNEFREYYYDHHIWKNVQDPTRGFPEKAVSGKVQQIVSLLKGLFACTSV